MINQNSQELTFIRWNELRNSYGKFLMFFPLNESEKKDYIKLTSKQKFGFINRRMIRMYKQLNLNSQLLKLYFETKNSYRIFRRPNISFEKYRSRQDVDSAMFNKNQYLLTQITLSLLNSIFDAIIPIINTEVEKIKNKKLEDEMVL